MFGSAPHPRTPPPIDPLRLMHALPCHRQVTRLPDLPLASAKPATPQQVWAPPSHAPDAAGPYRVRDVSGASLTGWAHSTGLIPTETQISHRTPVACLAPPLPPAGGPRRASKGRTAHVLLGPPLSVHRKMAKKVVGQTGRPLSWTTPLGVPVVQPYVMDKAYDINRRTTGDSFNLPVNMELMQANALKQVSSP